jgi:hypothetical protein
MPQSLTDYVASMFCEVCGFREVAGWPTAVAVNIPVEVLELGFCGRCRAWLGTANGVIVDGMITFRLRDEHAGERGRIPAFVGPFDSAA